MFKYTFVVANSLTALAVAQHAAAAPDDVAAARCVVTPSTAPAPAPRGTAGITAAPALAPTDSVKVTPGTLQRAIAANGENTSFLLLPGDYKDASVTPKNGDRFYGEGKVTLDGDGTQELAFILANVHDVLISGIKFIHFNPPRSAGLFGVNGGSLGFVVEGCEIAYNGGGTPIVLSNGTRVSNNSVHDNLKNGIGGYGVTMAVISHNEVYDNFLLRTDPDTATGEASGMKFMKTEMISVTENYVHDNYGVGIWFDTDNTKVAISRNVIQGNTHRGVMDEISYDTVISDNTILGNGSMSGWVAGAGIFIATAGHVEICNNVLKENSQGIVGFQNDRGSGEAGKYLTTDVKVHGNFIDTLKGVTGLTSGAENDPSNRFFDNHYCLHRKASFLWGAHTDRSGWQEAGQDLNGSFSCGF